jgi:hypothetical protein
VFDLAHHSRDVFFSRNVTCDRGRADVRADASHSVAVTVDDDDRPWTLFGEARGERATDASRRAGDDDDPIDQLHRNLIA